MDNRDPVRSVRISDGLWFCVYAEMQKHNSGACNVPLTMSDVIRVALEQWMDKRARSRKRRPARPTAERG